MEMFQHTKPLYTVPETLELLSQSRGKFYEEVRTGAIHIIKRGRRSLVTAAEIDRYIEEKSSQIVTSVVSGGVKRYVSSGTNVVD
jgi:hypothetical protein